MNSNALRPYIMDYYIPLKWEFLDNSGKRNGLYKFKNAVLHTLRRLRTERKAMNIFDRVHEIIVADESREELKLNISRTEERSPFNNVSFMSRFPQRRSFLRSNTMTLVNRK